MTGFAADIAKTKIDWAGTGKGELLTHHAAAYIAGVSFEAGADTTKNTLLGFVKVRLPSRCASSHQFRIAKRKPQAMVLFPEVQIQGQEELDRVIAVGSMPSAEDAGSFPYIRGIVKESLRCTPPSAYNLNETYSADMSPGMPTAINGAVPHAAMNSDEVDGHHIPAGAGIVLAVWSANNDPTLFHDPRLFDPKRHRSDTTIGESMTAAEVRDHATWNFCAGRRICPGMHVAETSLFLAIARILWAFNIRESKNGNVDELHIDRDAVTPGLAAKPVPFR